MLALATRGRRSREGAARATAPRPERPADPGERRLLPGVPQDPAAREATCRVGQSRGTAATPACGNGPKGVRTRSPRLILTSPSRAVCKILSPVLCVLNGAHYAEVLVCFHCLHITN